MSGKITSIPRNQIAKLDTSGVSMMPPGLTSGLHPYELLYLLHYLKHLKQPLEQAAETALHAVSGLSLWMKWFRG